MAPATSSFLAPPLVAGLGAASPSFPVMSPPPRPDLALFWPLWVGRSPPMWLPPTLPLLPPSPPPIPPPPLLRSASG
ncbi:hypothetical protein GUJ93_ZPchr0004g39991 [Zizania palustris]|uniref:Uncharacterized protein n=1 Tax=Zizania palustris TaxID=103762 RepID=A0A8J5VYE8_ZIZPA|nr:hypothetical protein GUJ93_ZPchr0004g39991 [Zizania palustris]